MRAVFASVAGVAISAVTLVHCSLLVDTDGLAGSGGNPGDAGREDVASDATSEAASDGSTVSLDGGPRCNAAAGFTSAFCDDFDHGLGTTWTGGERVGGTLSVDVSKWRSAPGSLLTGVPETTDAGIRKANLLRDFEAPSRLRCSFDLMEETRPASGPPAISLGVFVASPDASYYGIYFALGVDAPFFSEETKLLAGGGGLTGEGLPIIAKGVWYRVTVDMDFAAHTYVVSYNGVTVLQTKQTPVKIGRVTVGLGITFTASQAAWSVRYDDFVCDAR
jgi:hypothetical protein